MLKVFHSKRDMWTILIGIALVQVPAYTLHNAAYFLLILPLFMVSNKINKPKQVGVYQPVEVREAYIEQKTEQDAA